MGAIDTMKEIAGLIQKLDNVELIKQLVTLQEQVFTLAEENRTLKTRLATREQLSFRKNSYWLGDDGPFCSRCWDAENNLVRLHLSREFSPSCPKCDKPANDPDAVYRPYA